VTDTAPPGRLAQNIVYFARALRAAGIPVGPGAVIDALNALQGDEVLLCLRDGNSSCLLRAPASEQSRHVIMPLRL
jgi:uncharacterized protein with von Willebrand factor type A (vWA) domain